MRIDNRRMNRSLTPFFDMLNLAICEPASRRPPSVAHCDCHEANRAFLKKRAPKKRNGIDSYFMVPTELRANGLCAYCGHTPYYQPPLTQDQVLTKGSTGEVLATCLRTGKLYRFASASQAVREGFGEQVGIGRAIKSGLEYRGFKWVRLT